MAVETALYRSLLRLARQLDRPVLKALICRNHGAALPEALDAVVARFLGGPEVNYYWPAVEGQPRSVVRAAREAFRHPAAGAHLEDAFAGVRYLSGLVAVARRHGLLVEAAGQHSEAVAATAAKAKCEDAQQQAQQQQLAQGPGGGGEVQLRGRPERGHLLLAHPCLPGSIFSRSVVLLCRHDPLGSYGLALNKALGSSLKHLHHRIRQLQDSSQPGSWGGGGGALFGGGDGGAGAAEAGRGGPAAAAAPGAAGAAAGQLRQRADPGPRRRGAPGDAAALQSVLAQALLLAQLHQGQAAGRRDEYDDCGNWVEAPYDSAEEEEASGSDGEEAVARSFRAGSDSDDGGAAVAAARGGNGDELARVVEALQRAQRGQAEVVEVDSEEEGSGVMAALDAALRRAGGGTALLLDSEGQVWSHQLPPGRYATTDDSEEEEEEDGWSGPAADGPQATLDLLLASLTPQDRLLLQAQHEAAARERGQTARQPRQGEGAAGLQQQAAVAEGAAPAAPASKAQRFMAEVHRLVSSPQAADSASSLFGTGSSGGGSGATARAGGGGAPAAVGGRPGGDNEAATLSALMALFGDSPLFRGGPVPGVQLLHRRQRLGGRLVLPPGGVSPAATEPAPDGAAPGQAAGSAPELEGGLFVGAALERAQALSEEGYLGPADVRVCMGDAAWVAGQLEGEVARGTWAVASTTPAFLDLFGPAATQAAAMEGGAAGGGDDGSDGHGAAPGYGGAAHAYEHGMWAKCLRALGGEYAELARLPRGIWTDLAELEV